MTDFTDSGVFVSSHNPPHLLRRVSDDEWETLCGAIEVVSRFPHTALRGSVGFMHPDEVETRNLCGNCLRIAEGSGEVEF